ncbi:S-acyltransferase-like [Raphidocelis subcapitata]|uniref:S-acyltransferase n=1 Tax=Raphidocelis subcapitata TaxID=307507 RepID=A0A2V0PIV6_9CHLO|nr:S-acyltransferase-like [Raphidocelis subcapitata]|eukprot:GBF99728.1 S-acyltransferase-like [Raphidocelis subcapitata]
MGWESVAYLNCFRLCKCLRAVGNVMVLFVLGLVGLSWYAVVPAHYGRTLASGPPAAAAGSFLAIAVFTLLAAMSVWSYLTCVTTNPGYVPEGWMPFPDEASAQSELDRIAAAGPYGAPSDKSDPRRPRFCKHCRAWKPERAHHCSVSGRCVLRMDHYCIWVVNCVGLLNYKFFLQFLAYTLLASLLAVALLVKPVVDFFAGRVADFGAPTAFVVVMLDGAFAAALLGFLAMHAQLVSHACTTIEMYEKERPTPWPYDRGTRRNWEEVMGRSKLSWLLPRHTPEERQHMLDSCLGQRLLSGAGAV